MRRSMVVLLLLVASLAAAQVSVVSTTPAHNTTGVPLMTTVSVTFSGPVDTSRGFKPGENFFTNVTSAVGQWWSADRRTINFDVVLQPSTVYFLLIHGVEPVAGGGFPVPYVFYWTTGASFPVDLHSVSGTITSGSSPVTPDNAVVGLGATPFTGSDPVFVGGAVTDALGQFTVPYVADGTWYPLAAKDADLNGVIDPTAGDPIAFGDSVVVNGTDVSGFTMGWQTFGLVRFADARESITSFASQLLPPDRELRQFYAWNMDSTGAAQEWIGMYTVPGSPRPTEIWMESFGVRWDSNSHGNDWAYGCRPFPNLATAALIDSVVAHAENMGGREFRRQAPSVPGSEFNAYARLGALHNTEFGWLVSDTSQYYWGLQYAFQVRVSQDSSYPVAWKIFIASASTGEILSVTGADDQGTSPLPSVYDLGQNYPNPFNPSTVVSYQLPAASDVKLVVYDLLGREVSVLVDEMKMPGKYEVQVDARNLASGVYLYRLTAGTFVQTRKMILMK